MSDDTTPDQRARIARAYRGLEAAEPPRALDEAILAAARREAAAPTRPRSRRWALPLSIAAVVVLSLTVTVRIEEEKPGVVAPTPETARAPRAEPPVAVKPAPAETAASRALPMREKAAADARSADQPAAVASSAPRASVEGAERAERRARDAAPAAAGASAPQTPAAALRAPEPPERELERIAALRRQGRHEEADKALAEFRKKYPDYRIAEEMLEKVEQR